MQLKRLYWLADMFFSLLPDKTDGIEGAAALLTAQRPHLFVLFRLIFL